jgi:hypothetical protein
VQDQVFNPAWGNATVVANSATATAAVNLPISCTEVALYNTSATALTVVYVTPYESATVPTGTAPTTSLGMPVPPGQLIRVRVGPGAKVIRTIASAADGNIWIIPGRGG